MTYIDVTGSKNKKVNGHYYPEPRLTSEDEPKFSNKIYYMERVKDEDTSELLWVIYNIKDEGDMQYTNNSASRVTPESGWSTIVDGDDSILNIRIIAAKSTGFNMRSLIKPDQKQLTNISISGKYPIISVK